MNHVSHRPARIAGASLTALLGVALLGSATLVRAAGDETITLNPYTVTSDSDEGYMSQETLAATGANSNLMKIPQTIQIINSQLMKDLAVGDDFTQALQIAVGGVDRRSYNPGDDFFMWGFRINTTLKDGLPYFSNGLNVGYDVLRVEAIKGPSAMMYGQNSYVGGVLNFVTRQPSRTAKYELDLTYGKNRYERAAFHAAGPISKSLSYRADIGETNSDGNGRKFSYYRNRFIGGAVQWDISDHAKFLLESSYQTENSMQDLTMLDPATNEILVAPSSFTVSEPWSHLPKTTFRVMGTLTTILGPDFTSRTVLGYSNWTNDWLRDQTNAINVAAHTINKFTSSFSTSNHFQSLQQDFVKDMKWGTYVSDRLTFGGDIRNEVDRNNTNLYSNDNAAFNYLNPVYNISLPDPSLTPPSGSTNSKSRSRISGLYVQDQVGIWDDKLILLGGIRYNDQMTTSGAPNASGVTTPTQTLSYGSYNAPRYGVVLNPIQPVSLYYNYGESFTFQSGLDTYNNPFKPSVGKVREFGSKFLLVDGPKGSISASFAHINMEVTNVRVVFTQGPNDPNPGASGTKAAGTQTNHGYQFNINANRNFDNSGTLNFIATLYHGNIRNELGQKPAMIANDTWSVMGVYNFKYGVLNGFKIGANANYTGRQVGFTFPTTGVLTSVDPRTITGAIAGYTWKHYDIQLNVDDLSNKIYIAGAESPLWIYTNEGRTFKVTLSDRF